VNFFYRFILWQDGVHDMPELKALAPKEAYELLVQAYVAERDANFWREMSTRKVLWTLGLSVLLVVIIAGLVASGLQGILVLAVVLILPVFAVWATVSARKDQSRKLRPHILALLKARSSN
jgi:Flp pilus assembly protein TadB